MGRLILKNTKAQYIETLLHCMSFKIALFIILGIIVGIFLANDYGLSWDEYYNQIYAEHTLDMYFGKRAPGDTITDMRFYGPGFVVPWLLARNFLARFLPSWTETDAGHLIYWLSFLPAPLFVYGLSRRYASRVASLIAALLLLLQPVIFGHAFVNPKDTPFMTAFLGSIWLGLLAVDLNAQSNQWLSLHSFPSEVARLLRKLITTWTAADTWRKVSVCILWGAIILISIDLLISHWFLRWSYLIVQRAYAGRAFAPIQALFNTVAQDAYKTPLAAYLVKVRVFYLWVRFTFLIGGFGLLIYVSSRILGSRISKRWFSRIRTWWTWIIASIVLGFCTAIRVFGPFAGALVALYALLRLKKKAWLPLTLYGSISALVLYTAWPSLWGSPVQHLAETIFRMSRFPWEGRIFYNGNIYSVLELPWHYVPRTIALQLTFPTLVLSSIGLISTILTFSKKRQSTKGEYLLFLWLGLPLISVVLLHSQIYSAFRQLMFVLPPLFILGSIGFDRMIRHLRSPFWTLILIGVVVAPGLNGIIRLHPYEMIFYNALTGGVSGAAGRYGLDDWGTTYRVVIEYLNEVAPQGARVLVNSNELHTLTPFARDDLEVNPLTPIDLENSTLDTYIVNSGRMDDILHAITVYIVEREGVTLATVQLLQ